MKTIVKQFRSFFLPFKN